MLPERPGDDAMSAKRSSLGEENRRATRSWSALKTLIEKDVAEQST
jgi:hypothetical protein